jgi:hypothetical protein
LHEAVHSPDQIAAHAGWTPDLTSAEELLLVELADPHGSLTDFTVALRAATGGARLAAAWRRALADRPGSDQEESTA